jgi:hypothetical protein
VCLFLTYIHLLTGGLRKMTALYTLPLLVAIIVCWLATMAILLRRKTRAWFQLAERLRVEHRRLLAG